jgi:DNA-binding NtrC family response regulator
MPSQTRVLIVDDEPAIRNSLVEFLEDCKFDLYSADSAEHALDLIARIPIDVAVVDIRLPKLDGDSLIMQAHLLRPNIRFLIHTGSVEYKLPEDLRNLGVTPEHVFHKPQMDLSVFETAINQLMHSDAD